VRYDMIHVTPPMAPPAFVRTGPLANADGWVDVDKFSLQHVRHPDVFALGDCSNLPTSKTGAAIRKQAPVVVANLLALRAGQPLPARYDGYTSCPVVTGRGKLIMAEFNYAKEPVETFPVDQREERFSMYALKAYMLPRLYWHGMLRGRA
jgi:sulfide:quinone oxidoreductase